MQPTAASSQAVDPVLVGALRERLAGSILLPTDPAYEDARRVWNGTIDRRPALIARCAGVADVMAGVEFARQRGLPLSVRGGGHNVAGTALVDGGLVLDLSPMKGIRVDPAARRVHAQAGVTIGELDHETQAYGLAAPLGVVTDTGIAGLTLHGGLGWLRRRHGLSCDALRSVDLVTADGIPLHASPDENSDLFWAVRGGGGGFGTVTDFEYELHDVGPEVFFVAVFYPRSVAAGVLRFLRDYMAGAPDDFSPIAVVTHVPELEFIPAEHHGQPCVAIAGPYVGGIATGEREVAPLRKLGTPIADLSGPLPWVEVQRFFDEDYPAGGRYYWKSINLAGLREDAVERLLELNDAAPSAASTLDVWFLGGAMGRVASDATAFGSRAHPILVGVEANWRSPADDDTNIAWARRAIDALRPFSLGGLYLNFPGLHEEGDQMLRESYGPNYARLAGLKQTWDPGGLFGGAFVGQVA